MLKNIDETDDPVAAELWDVAQEVVIATALRPLEELVRMDADDWERIIPRVPGVRTFETDLRHSAIVALAISMRSTIELEKRLIREQGRHLDNLRKINDRLSELRRDFEEEL